MRSVSFHQKTNLLRSNVFLVHCYSHVGWTYLRDRANVKHSIVGSVKGPTTAYTIIFTDAGGVLAPLLRNQGTPLAIRQKFIARHMEAAASLG